MFERVFEFVEGRAAMQRMLQLDRPPTAVFCANDVQAIGALSECRDAGLSVPSDISIVGFDDMPIAQYITPKLTTVRVPAQEMGDSAAKRLIAAIETSAPVLPLELSTDLVIRETTARCLRGKNRADAARVSIAGQGSKLALALTIGEPSRNPAALADSGARCALPECLQNLQVP